MSGGWGVTSDISGFAEEIFSCQGVRQPNSQCEQRKMYGAEVAHAKVKPSPDARAI